MPVPVSAVWNLCCSSFSSDEPSSRLLRVSPALHFRSSGGGAKWSVTTYQEGRYKATWKRDFQLPWREAGQSDHLDGNVDSDQ